MESDKRLSREEKSVLSNRDVEFQKENNFESFFRNSIKMSQAEFDQAAEQAKNLSKKPSDDEMLKLYGLFKRKEISLRRNARLMFFSSIFRSDNRR